MKTLLHVKHWTQSQHIQLHHLVTKRVNRFFIFIGECPTDQHTDRKHCGSLPRIAILILWSFCLRIRDIHRYNKLFDTTLSESHCIYSCYTWRKIFSITSFNFNFCSRLTDTKIFCQITLIHVGNYGYGIVNVGMVSNFNKHSIYLL